MGRQSRRQQNRRSENVIPMFNEDDYGHRGGRRKQNTTRSPGYDNPRYVKNLQPKTEGQAVYLEKLEKHDMVFAEGPAGSGKTYIAIQQGMREVSAGRYRRLILTRPAVEAGEKLGYLPGDMKEKVDPYMLPMYDILETMMSPQQVKGRMSHGEIVVAPVAFMRGRTLEDAFIVVDEAQNCTLMQLKMLMTRMGKGSKMVFTGDRSQSDLPVGQSGLGTVIDAVMASRDTHRMGAVELTAADVVRHPAVVEALRILDGIEAGN